MSAVRFVERSSIHNLNSNLVDVSYGWPSADYPQVGDLIETDGSDKDFEEGNWKVVRRTWRLGDRGLLQVVATVERI